MKILALVTILVGLAAPAAAAIESAGSITTCQTGPGFADCQLSSGGRIRVELVREDVARVRVSSGATFIDRPTGALVPRLPAPVFQTFDAGDAIFLVSPRLAVLLIKAPLRIAMWRSDGSIVSVDQENGLAWDRATGLIVTRKMALPGEHYLGMGERGGPIDRRGRHFTMRNVDWSGFDSQTDPLYISIPFYYAFRSGTASGVFLDSGATSFFDFDSATNGTLSFGVRTGELDYYVMSGPQPPDVSSAYRWLTGPNHMPPIWALGYHQSRYSYETQDDTIFVAWLLRQLQVPADVLYFDIDYLDQLRAFTWNPAAFPDPAWMNMLLKSWGFHSVNIMEPVYRTDDPNYDSLADQNFFLTGPGGEPLVNEIWYGEVSWLDFSKTVVREWYKDALKTFIGSYAIDGVWNDLNEPAQNFMPEAIYDFDGQPRSDVEARNLYALLQAKASFEAQLELRPNQRPWIFSRSGFAGFHRYGANWGGDANSSFESLLTNVETSASMGVSGQPFFGHDIGGFLGSPSSELFLRWLTFSAYTPLFRNHAANTSARREPWAFGLEDLSVIRNVINERYRLIPYIYSLFDHDARHGRPVIAPLPFHFPQDEATFATNDQFLLGPSLLVAPVTVEGAQARSVYLPAGASWVNQRTDALEAGGRSVLVSAARDEVPVFVRDGSIIPRAPVAESTAAQPLDRRILDVYCGAPATFDLYEDDGVTRNREQGEYLTSRLQCSPGPAMEITIERLEGSWAPPQGRTWTLNVHRVPVKPGSVSKGGTPLPFASSEAALDGLVDGWTYTAAGMRLIVKVLDHPLPLAVRVQP